MNYEAALRGPAGEECIFLYRLTDICDECTRREIYSGQSCRMQAVLPCGADGSPASLKFGV